MNDDSQGYHDTITHVFVAGVRLFLRSAALVKLAERVIALLAPPMGRRDSPERFYLRERLFSMEARRRFVQPA